MADKGEFLLKSYSPKDNIEFAFKGHRITLTRKSDNIERLGKLATELDLLSEISTLTIIGPLDANELRDMAVDIKNLLSIAIGKRVRFDRQIYWEGETPNVIERPMSKNENEGEQIIPDFEIVKYLTRVLPIWTNFSKEQKDVFFTITDYLNQTQHDFIEDRILRTVQAWECAAFNWIPDSELPKDLAELKERIKDTYRAWKKERDYNDPSGELGTRLTAPFDQEKLMLRLERLVVDSRLDTSKTKLDLRMLKNLRDKVAHKGRIDVNGSQAIQYLKPAIRVLQLIVLRRLSFDGRVFGDENGWSTIQSIDEYFV